MNAAVEIQDLNFTYRRSETPALQRINYSQPEGQVVALIGPSGAGKSSLVRCLNRIIPKFFQGDFNGQVRLFENDITQKRTPELAATVGVVLQDFESQLFSTSAELDVAFGPENLGLDSDEIERRIARSLSLTGLEQYRERDPASLSGGQKQRLAIATVLAIEPRLIALDEATTDLDPQGKAEVSTIIRELAQRGMTVIMVEHEPEQMRAADRIVILKQGRILCDGQCSEVLADVDFLINSGVRPPDPPRICQALGLPQRPIEVEPAKDLLKQQGISFDPSAISRILQEDQAQKLGNEIISVKDLCHEYPGGVQALRSVDLSVRSREFLAIIGQNGSGKTTLVSHLIGLLKPTSGSVFFEGQDISTEKTAQLGRQIGYVFQNPDNQIFSPRVFDEVAFGPRNYGFSEDEVAERVRKALELVDLAHAPEMDPFVMTKGERQRVAVASILASDPGVLILDEPTTGLDYNEQRAVMDMLAKLNEQGHTVIIITHTLWVVAEYATRSLLMADGKIISDGPTREVLSKPDLLKQASLRMPEITEISLSLGFPCLSLDEFKKLALAGNK